MSFDIATTITGPINSGVQLLYNVRNQTTPFLKSYSHAAMPYFQQMQHYSTYVKGGVGLLLFFRGMGDLTRSKKSKIQTILTIGTGAFLFTEAVCQSFPLESPPIHRNIPHLF